jgi:hypothetical protein
MAVTECRFPASRQWKLSDPSRALPKAGKLPPIPADGRCGGLCTIRVERHVDRNRCEVLRPAAAPEAARAAVRATLLAHGNASAVAPAAVVTTVAIAGTVGPGYGRAKSNGNERCEYSQHCLPHVVHMSFD